MLYVFSQYDTLTFEIPAVKCCYGVEVNWSRYRDTGVSDPALQWCVRKVGGPTK